MVPVGPNEAAFGAACPKDALPSFENVAVAPPFPIKGLVASFDSPVLKAAPVIAPLPCPPARPLVVDPTPSPLAFAAPLAWPFVITPVPVVAPPAVRDPVERLPPPVLAGDVWAAASVLEAVMMLPLTPPVVIVPATMAGSATPIDDTVSPFPLDVPLAADLVSRKGLVAWPEAVPVPLVPPLPENFPF